MTSADWLFVLFFGLLIGSAFVSMFHGVYRFFFPKNTWLRDWRKGHAEYLKSEHWREFSLKVRQKAGVCQVYKCGEKEMKNLHTHHLHYDSVGREKESDVIVLCNTHHKATHAGRRLILLGGRKVLPPFGKVAR